MLEFKNIEFLLGLILILPMLFMVKNKKNDLETIFSSSILEKIKFQSNGFSKKTRSIFLISAFSFMIIGFARPIINNGEIKVKSSFINMVVAIDMSKSMFANDVYPTRFEYAKKKFIDMLKNLKNTKVSLIGFSSDTFLISPLTQDFHSLKFLTSNLHIDNVSLKGTNILNTLKTANDLMKDEEKKILFLFTDGAENKDLKKELDYAKANNITVYIYGVGTIKGGIIDTPNGALKDKNQDIVVVKLNENIKVLALNSGGAYMKQTLKNNDVKILANEIINHFNAKDDGETTIKDKQELFIIFLALAFILLILALFSLPKKLNIKGKK